MSDIEFVDPNATPPQQDSNLPVAAKRFYTTVSKDGKQVPVPYHPGRFSTMRAVELLLSGYYLSLATDALKNGQPWLATALLAISLFEFYCGMKRWPEDKE